MLHCYQNQCQVGIRKRIQDPAALVVVATVALAVVRALVLVLIPTGAFAVALALALVFVLGTGKLYFLRSAIGPEFIQN